MMEAGARGAGGWQGEEGTYPIRLGLWATSFDDELEEFVPETWASLEHTAHFPLGFNWK